jgi:hypothetical protein
MNRSVQYCNYSLSDSKQRVHSKKVIANFGYVTNQAHGSRTGSQIKNGPFSDRLKLI